MTPDINPLAAARERITTAYDPRLFAAAGHRLADLVPDQLHRGPYDYRQLLIEGISDMRLLSFALLLALAAFCFGCGAESSYENREVDQNAPDDAYEYDLEEPEAAPEP